MIIVQVKGTQNICCDGNTSMSKSLTSKRQNLKKKTKKKHENGVEHKKVSFLAVSWSIGES